MSEIQYKYRIHNTISELIMNPFINDLAHFRVELFAADEDIFAISKYTAKPMIFINLPKYRF